MPARRPAKAKGLTIGDRSISALVGGVCGFLTMLLIWLLVMYWGGRFGQDVVMPFYWTWVAGGIAAAVSFAAGPERMMDGFGNLWRAIAWLFYWV